MNYLVLKELLRLSLLVHKFDKEVKNNEKRR